MSKLSIEVDSEKLSEKGMSAYRTLMDELYLTKTDRTSKKQTNDSLASAAARLIRILIKEPNGNQFSVIRAFASKGQPFLTYAELILAANKRGPALAGTLSSLTKNWRKAGMVGRSGISYKAGFENGLPDGGAYYLASGDKSVLKAITDAINAPAHS
jgi:hypothetical protein